MGPKIELENESRSVHALEPVLESLFEIGQDGVGVQVVLEL